MRKRFLFWSIMLIGLLVPPKEKLIAQQNVTLDWKLHNVGKVRQLITNQGATWRASTDYPGLIYCEFPPNSNEEHIGEGGPFVGGIVQGDTLVSVTTIWANPHFEFFPTGEPWDTVWVVQKGDTVDIPYWPGYTAVSDQDMVCRYRDDQVTSGLGDHVPMHLEIIQTSYAWSSPPLDEFIVYNFWIIPRQVEIQQAYIGYWLDGNVGDRGPGFDFAFDDLSVFYPDRWLAAAVDPPGGTDGTAYSPIGIKIYLPEHIDPATLTWTWNWFPGGGLGGPSDLDPELYQQISEGVIMQNQEGGVGSQFIFSFGPFTLSPGDTFHFKVGQVLGEGEEGMLRNLDRLDWLVEQNFAVPSPPPRPPLRVISSNKTITLRWDPLPGQPDPETYQDPHRADGALQPFEGYRVYKSTQSINGPWTLLAEYDVPGNEFNNNTGLAYEYTDRGLLNNLEYYYSVTAFSKPDTVSGFPSLESSLTANAVVAVPGTAPPETVGQVAVVPNPYRGDINYNAFDPKWERNPPGRPWLEQDRRIQFINLPAHCEIKIYTLAGDEVATLLHRDPQRGYEDWNLTSSVGQAISSGIYLFSVRDLETGNIQVGKFVVIK